MASPPTWKVDSGKHGRTRGHRGMHQVRVLESEPSSKRTWIRPAERHPLPVGQPPALPHHSAEVCKVSQSLATAEETQVVCAEVPKWRKSVENKEQIHKHKVKVYEFKISLKKTHSLWKSNKSRFIYFFLLHKIVYDYQRTKWIQQYLWLQVADVKGSMDACDLQALFRRAAAAALKTDNSPGEICQTLAAASTTSIQIKKRCTNKTETSVPLL